MPKHGYGAKTSALVKWNSASNGSRTNLSSRRSTLHSVESYRRKHSTLEVAFPKSWWDHFKLRWFPLWAKHRWPVLYGKTTKTVELDGHVLYPEVVIPKYRDDFRIRKSPVLEVNS